MFDDNYEGAPDVELYYGEVERIPEDDGEYPYEEHDPFLTDAEADADALRSCGWGTDEDYNPCMEGE